MKTNATQRSLAYLRKNGWQAAIVEKYIKHPNMAFGRRIDVWGFGDLLACHPRGMTALVQTFPLAQWKAHVETINNPEPDKEGLTCMDRINNWKRAGNILYFHGWALKPKGGIRGAKKTWQLREEIF